MTEEDHNLRDDVGPLCVEAKSFPDGVMESFQELERMIPKEEGRALFGISYPGKDWRIVYRAAAKEAFNGESRKLGAGSFTVPAGTYISVSTPDFMSDESRIGNAFRELLADPRIDPQGCCVEMYVNGKDVRCMVRLDPQKADEERKTV